MPFWLISFRVGAPGEVSPGFRDWPAWAAREPIDDREESPELSILKSRQLCCLKFFQAELRRAGCRRPRRHRVRRPARRDDGELGRARDSSLATTMSSTSSTSSTPVGDDAPRLPRVLAGQLRRSERCLSPSRRRRAWHASGKRLTASGHRGSFCVPRGPRGPLIIECVATAPGGGSRGVPGSGHGPLPCAVRRAERPGCLRAALPVGAHSAGEGTARAAPLHREPERRRRARRRGIPSRR